MGDFKVIIQFSSPSILQFEVRYNWIHTKTDIGFCFWNFILIFNFKFIVSYCIWFIFNCKVHTQWSKMFLSPSSSSSSPTICVFCFVGRGGELSNFYNVWFIETFILHKIKLMRNNLLLYLLEYVLFYFSIPYWIVVGIFMNKNTIELPPKYVYILYKHTVITAPFVFWIYGCI